MSFLYMIAVTLVAVILFVYIVKSGTAEGWQAKLLAFGLSLVITTIGRYVWPLLDQLKLGILSGKFIAMIIVPVCIACWYKIQPAYFEKYKKQITWALQIYLLFLMISSLV